MESLFLKKRHLHRYGFRKICQIGVFAVFLSKKYFLPFPLKFWGHLTARHMITESVKTNEFQSYLQEYLYCLCGIFTGKSVKTASLIIVSSITLTPKQKPYLSGNNPPHSERKVYLCSVSMPVTSFMFDQPLSPGNDSISAIQLAVVSCFLSITKPCFLSKYQAVQCGHQLGYKQNVQVGT